MQTLPGAPQLIWIADLSQAVPKGDAERGCNSSRNQIRPVFSPPLPWIPEPSTVNNKLKRREGSGIQGNRPLAPI
jgi:hypothetical protein